MEETKPKDKMVSKLGASNKSITPVTSLNVMSSSSSSVNVSPANAALQYVMKGQVDKLVQCFENATDPNHDTIGIQISQRSMEDGRNPLDWAAILGRDSIIPELLKRGVDVNSVTEKGYTAAHFAAAWGQVASLRMLNSGGANFYLKNLFSETPRDVAKRNGKHTCVDYLDWTGAYCLGIYNGQAGINAMIAEQLQWLDKVTDDTTLDDIIEHREAFETYTQPIINKLTTPENGEKLDKSKSKNQDKKA